MATLNPDVCTGLDADAVKEIIDTDLTDARINNFVNFAYYMTLPLVGSLGQCGGDDALCEIQLLLAAHFLTMYERTTKSENVAGEWSVAYAIKEGEGLKASLYGQQALMLDCSGKLAAAGMRKATFAVISYHDTEDSEIDSDLI